MKELNSIVATIRITDESVIPELEAVRVETRSAALRSRIRLPNRTGDSQPPSLLLSAAVRGADRSGRTKRALHFMRTSLFSGLENISSAVAHKFTYD